MTKTTRIVACSLLFISLTACTSHYKLSSTSRTRIVVDNRYDATHDATADAFIIPYKQKVDSIMGPVVGMVAHDMAAERPERDLSNLLSDVLVWAAKDYNEQPVMGLYNMGGIRAALSKGKVTYGDVLDIAPFENKICFLTLTGEALLEVFQQMAYRGGEGVSKGTELVIEMDKDNEHGKLVSARLHGKDIDPKGEYRIATINYLIEGNDGMPSLGKGTNLVAPNDASNNTRFLIMNYFREHQARGEVVDAQIEGRITIKK
jgi:2',3'-cyclic-nucleotide 2'-phosphodiesterase (5'-nucleotidase family)